jgi:hypothetical protein
MQSVYHALSRVSFPEFSGTRIMMMPVILGEIETVSPLRYRPLIQSLFDLWPRHVGEVGYLTIDERVVPAGTSHRAPGRHIDAPVNHGGGGSPPRPSHGAGGSSGGWGGGGPWAGLGTGMLLVSDVPGCRAWRGEFSGTPGPEGECDHLTMSADTTSEILQAYRVYWLDGRCVHESVPFERDTRRALVRLSMPSQAPWYEGYTRSPYGVQPTGPILPRRHQMGYAA